jgi:DNA primase
MDKPNIVSVISESIVLRKVGKEYVGRCPFHADKTPSLSVNEDRGVFHCFGCGASGDVIRFIELIEGVSFKEALSILGLVDESKLRPVTAIQREAASLAAAWMAEQRRKINALLGEVLEQIELADEIGDGELAESFLREQSFLRDLYEDLEISRYAADLLSIRPMIEALTEGVEAPEIHFEFPPSTPKYRAHLEAIARGTS